MIGCPSKVRPATRELLLSLPAISNNYGNHYEPRFSHRLVVFLPPSAISFPLPQGSTQGVGAPFLHPPFCFSFVHPLYILAYVYTYIYIRIYAGVNACTREKAHVKRSSTISFNRTWLFSLSSLATFLTVKLSLPRLRSARVNMKENSIVCKQAARFEAPGSVRWVRRVSMIENCGTFSLSLSFSLPRSVVEDCVGLRL